MRRVHLIAAAAATAGLSLGVVAPQAQAGTTPGLKYACTAKVFGQTQNEGVWTATISAPLPAKVARNASIPAVKVTAKVVTSASSANRLRALKVKNLKGTSASTYTVSGAVKSPGSRSAGLTVPLTAVPATGPITTTATGTSKAEVAGPAKGSIVVKVGNFTANLVTNSGFKIPVTCTQAAGQNNTLGTIAVS